MKRSRVNRAITEAKVAFAQNGWTLPAYQRWDVTDFGLGNFEESGLTLLNLAEEAEYCEKLMFAHKGQVTPAHCHKVKKEDIISRYGILAVKVWNKDPREADHTEKFDVKISGQFREVNNADVLEIKAGERITLVPGVYHAFYPLTDYCIIGEVSTANDDLNDNFFIDPEIGRYSQIEEDEKPLLKLLSDK